MGYKLLKIDPQSSNYLKYRRAGDTFFLTAIVFDFCPPFCGKEIPLTIYHGREMSTISGVRCHSVFARVIPRTLGTSAVCSPVPTSWDISVLCVPFKPSDFRIKQNKKKYINKGKLSWHNDKLSLHLDNFFSVIYDVAADLPFVSFILHHRKNGKLSFTRIRAF